MRAGSRSQGDEAHRPRSPRGGLEGGQVCSEASSSDHEPDSLAILIRADFPRLASWTVGLLASDLSPERVAKTEKGDSSQLEANRGLPAPPIAKHVANRDIRWPVNDDVRGPIRCRTLDLLESLARRPSADVVFIRNALIHCEPELKKEILEKIRKLLVPGGYLVLGGAESRRDPDSHDERLDRTRSDGFQRAGD